MEASTTHDNEVTRTAIKLNVEGQLSSKAMHTTNSDSTESDDDNDHISENKDKQLENSCYEEIPVIMETSETSTCKDTDESLANMYSSYISHSQAGINTSNFDLDYQYDNPIQHLNAFSGRLKTCQTAEFEHTDMEAPGHLQNQSQIKTYNQGGIHLSNCGLDYQYANHIQHLNGFNLNLKNCQTTKFDHTDKDTIEKLLDQSEIKTECADEFTGDTKYENEKMNNFSNNFNGLEHVQPFTYLDTETLKNDSFPMVEGNNMDDNSSTNFQPQIDRNCMVNENHDHLVNSFNIGSLESGNTEQLSSNAEVANLFIQNMSSSLKEGKIICHFCDKEFKHETTLKTHMLLHTGEKPHICSVCNEAFARRQQLTIHEHTHNSKPHPCTLCNKAFNFPGELNIHMRCHSGEKPHICLICNKGFIRSSHLKTHMKHHTDEKTIECDLCGKKFVLNEEMRAHRQRHLTEKTIMCELCNKGFKTKYTYNAHMQLHTGENLHVCDICFKGYTKPSKLKQHMQTHFGIKPFTCGQCNKSFAAHDTLKIHMFVHTGERPYPCPECPTRFISSADLRKHSRMHSGEKPFQCPVCNKSFTRTADVKSHMTSHTDARPFMCSECDKGFKRLSCLKNHLATHTGNKPFKCSVCDKAFARHNALNAHVLLHSGELPFKCEVCSKAFNKKGNLNVHMKKHITIKTEAVNDTYDPFLNECFKQMEYNV